MPHDTAARLTLEILQRLLQSRFLNLEYFIIVLWSLLECCSLWSIKKARIHYAEPSAMSSQVLALLAHSIRYLVQGVVTASRIENSLIRLLNAFDWVRDI